MRRDGMGERGVGKNERGCLHESSGLGEAGIKWTEKDQ